MKSKSSYHEKAQTAAFEKNGAFFAFSNSQLNEKKVDGITYVNIGAGLICPKDNADNLVEELTEAHDLGIKADLAENSVRDIIWRELANYETHISGDFSDAVDSLKDYGISEEQIAQEFKPHMQHCIDNDCF